MPVQRLPIVGVFGSHKSLPSHQGAHDLGQRIAAEGWHLLTGGGTGAMAVVSEGFASVRVEHRLGRVIGIIPGDRKTTDANGKKYFRKDGYLNSYVEIAIFTHLPLSGKDGLKQLSRNHIEVLSSDAVVVLDGTEGTLSEAYLARMYHKPLVGLGVEAPELKAFFDLHSLPVLQKVPDVIKFVLDKLSKPPASPQELLLSVITKPNALIDQDF